MHVGASSYTLGSDVNFTEDILATVVINIDYVISANLEQNVFLHRLYLNASSLHTDTHRDRALSSPTAIQGSAENQNLCLGYYPSSPLGGAGTG